MTIYIQQDSHIILSKVNDICEKCNGTGLSGENNSDICNKCMGLGSRIRFMHGIFRNEERTNKYGAVAMILLGMVLIALVSSTGHVKVRWIFRITGFYLWVLFAGLFYDIISIPRFFSKLLGVS